MNPKLLTSLKPETHQTDIKDVAATKTGSCLVSRHLCRGQKGALKHAAKTAAVGQLAQREEMTLHTRKQRWSVFSSKKGEDLKNSTADIQTIVMIKQL